MIKVVYIFILSYFLLGAVGFYFINRNKEKEVAKKSWTKFISYFFIINIVFFSIVINPLVFRFLAAVIILVGGFELINLFRKNHSCKVAFFISSSALFVLFSAGFFLFSGMKMEVILFTFLELSIFDAFSQISGQLWGRKKIAPEISPNKTIGGTVGGAVVAMLSATILKDLTGGHFLDTMLLGAGIVLFAFAGDIAASLYKRKFNVKDFSNLIPGHGGVLDRFDSMIAGAAWVTLYFALF